MMIQTPDWVKDAVFYQIFPDRFARSPRMKHPRGIQFKPWGASPSEQGYQGGDLYGIVDHLDYLQDLGITALYLNPIFSAPSNHRYNAYDYLEVDPLLGGEPALRELLDEAHARNMRVVLDGVFNHCGRGFWAFHHILENGRESPYLDWFTINGFPLNAYPEDGKKSNPNYAAWWSIPSLPKFNTDNPGVRDYLLHVTHRWLEFGIDGWRLDVPAEIRDDSFWREFRQVVKGVNPEAYIVGEIWHEARRWLQGDMFDAVMNYMITGPLLSFFGDRRLNRSWKHADVQLTPIDAPDLVKKIDAMYANYDWQINYAQLNMLDSHDMPRALWLLENDKKALRQAVLFQMTVPGAPCVYYGDELGMSAGGDPHCREAIPWQQPERWDRELREFYQAAIALRKTNPALRTGDFHFLYAKDSTVLFRRRFRDQEALVAFNAGKKGSSFNLPATMLMYNSYRQVWPAGASHEIQVNRDSLSLQLASQEAVVLIAG